MLIPHEISMIISSDKSQGAINKSSDGSSFEIQLEEEIRIPRDALNCEVKVDASNIWWVIANISTGVNNKMYIFGDNDQGGSEMFDIDIPEGLYDLSGLNLAILTQLEASGAKTEDKGESLPLISLIADNNTQKVIIRFNYVNVFVDFTQQNTPRFILGFESAVYGPYINAPLNIFAPNNASFNTVNFFLIHSDLVSKGIRFNNTYTQTISQVLIDVAPGSQIVSAPFNPAKVSCPELVGASRKNLRFWLTDDKNRPVNTAGENYGFRLVIRYLQPFLTQNQHNEKRFGTMTRL